MFSVKNIARAAFLSTAVANTNAAPLSMAVDAEVGVIDRAADVTNNAMQQSGGGGGSTANDVPKAIADAMAATAAGGAAAELKEGFDMPDLGLGACASLCCIRSV